jgi:hypothetical protein
MRGYQLRSPKVDDRVSILGWLLGELRSKVVFDFLPFDINHCCSCLFAAHDRRLEKVFYVRTIDFSLASSYNVHYAFVRL